MSIKINLFGDMCLNGIDSRFSIPREMLDDSGATYNVVNLECPITEATKCRALQAKILSATTDAAHLLKGFHAVSLANNHIRDFLNEGVEDTIRFLNANGISWFGVGRSAVDAIRPARVDFHGIGISFIGATRYANSRDGDWGTAPDNTGLLQDVIRSEKRENRFVVIYLHAGYEYVRLPAPRERGLAKRCIQSGADVVVMAHPHIYQGIEWYRGKVIAYSLGNFVFAPDNFKGMSSVRDDVRLFESFYITLEIKPDFSYVAKLHGYKFDRNGISLYNAHENEKLIEDVEKNSESLQDSYLKYWRSYYRQAIDTCRQNKKVRERYVRVAEQKFFDRIKIYLDFNSQDFRNRLANLFSFLFK